MKTKKITSVLCALAIVCSMALSVSAQETAGDRITSAKTPTASNAVTQKWTNHYVAKSAYGDMAACGTPIPVGNYLYVTDNRGKLLKLSAQTGAEVKSASCSNIPPYFSQPTYGDGKIFVPQQTAKGVQISAYDADTLGLVWQSSEITSANGSLQIAAPITYYNHHIYFGTYVQDASWKYISGVFACLNAADGSSAWQYNNDKAGYYWSGSAAVGSAIVFADTAGNLVSHSLTGSTVYGTISLGDAVYSTPYYYNGKLYISVNNGNIVSLPLNSDNTFDTAKKNSVKIGNNITSSPVVYNGRVYVAGGGYGATTPFTVLNADTLGIVYQIKGILSQSTPLVSAAYATEENHHQVYIYVTNYSSGTTDPATYETKYNADSSCTYLIKDSAGQEAASFEKLINVSVPQSCTQSVAASDAGWLYYYNDSGSLFALAPVAVPAKPSNNAGNTSSTTTPVKNVPTGDSGASLVFFGAAAVSAVIFLAARKAGKNNR